MSSPAEDLFAAKLMATELPIPRAEVILLPPRKWRVDFCWPEHELVVEIDGGGYVHGRHHRPQGFEKDAEKLNAIAMAGYCVFRFTPAMVRSGLAVKTVEEYFERWYAIEEQEHEIIAEKNYLAEMGLSGDE